MSKGKDKQKKVPKIDVCYPVFYELIESYGSLDKVLEAYPQFADLIYPNSMQSDDEAKQCDQSQLVGVSEGADGSS